MIWTLVHYIIISVKYYQIHLKEVKIIQLIIM